MVNFRFQKILSTVASLLLIGLTSCQKKSDPSPSVEARGVTPPVLLKSAEPSSFEAVEARLDRGGTLYFYLSTEQWLAGLSQKIASFRELALGSLPASQNPSSRDQAAHGITLVADLVKKSGIEQVTGFGTSSIAIEPGLYRNKFFVHHHPGKGDGFLWTAFGKTAHPLKELDLLPTDTALASFTDLDLTQLIGGLRQEIAKAGAPEIKQGLDGALTQFSTMTGMSIDEVLQSLGGSAGLIVTLDPAKPIKMPIAEKEETIPAPRIAIMLAVKDDRIFDVIEKKMASNPQIVRVDEPGLRLRSLPVPVMPQLGLRPTVARWSNYLIVASDEKMIRDVIAAQKTGKGFKATPEFARLSSGMPTEGNSFQLTTQALADTVNRFQAEAVKNQPGLTPEHSALLKKLMDFQKAGAAYSVSSHLDNGWLAVGKGSQGAAQMMAPLLIAPVAVAAWTGLPALKKVKENSKASDSLNNAKQIGIGCVLYAQEHDGNFPPTLEALVPTYVPDAKAFISPFAPSEPMGFAYTPGLTDTSLPTTVLLEDKFAGFDGVRVVLYLDLSGKVTPLR